MNNEEYSGACYVLSVPPEIGDTLCGGRVFAEPKEFNPSEYLTDEIQRDGNAKEKRYR